MVFARAKSRRYTLSQEGGGRSEVEKEMEAVGNPLCVTGGVGKSPNVRGGWWSRSKTQARAPGPAVRWARELHVWPRVHRRHHALPRSPRQAACTLTTLWMKLAAGRPKEVVHLQSWWVEMGSRLGRDHGVTWGQQVAGAESPVLGLNICGAPR